MRILIAGLGAIGQRHARNLRRLAGGEVELLAFRRRRLTHVVTDSLRRDDTRSAETDLGVTVFSDIGEALASGPDAVFVCTPSSDHLEIATRAAESGCDLFIEKPLSHTMDGIDALRRIVSARGLAVLVGCQWRYHPCVRWLRETIEGGELGAVQRAEFEYAEYLPDWHPYEDYRLSYAARMELGGGVVLTQIHDYDLAWWLLGPIREVTATGGRLSDLEIDVEDTVDAHLDGRVPIRVKQTFASTVPKRKITVVFEAATVEVDLLSATIQTDDPGVAVPDVRDYSRNEMFLEEARHFLDCMRREQQPFVRLDDGIAVLRVALAVKESIAQMRAVSLPVSQLA